VPNVLVAGASGLVGAVALERLLNDGWDGVAVSRRAPDIDTDREFRHLAVDLRDADASRGALGELTGITHVIYAALYEKPGLIPGWQERDQMETNDAMLRNCLEPLMANNELENVSILQGTKAYGIHLHPMPIPARERYPRDDHANFYWLQEDYLAEQAAARGFRWSILRPQLIIGGAIGAAMNLAPIIGVYAAICQAEGRPFGFPGGISYVWEAVDTRVCAAALQQMATDERANGRHFNATNGEVFEWRNLWPSIADALGVAPGPDEPTSMAEFLPAHAATWDRVVSEHGLRPNTLDDILGESHYYADFCFAYGATEPPPPAFVSSIEMRKLGVDEYYDTEEMFRYWIGWLQDRKILPRL
jgi:nucleoside-diphosphate-sugar epimerase